MLFLFFLSHRYIVAPTLGFQAKGSRYRQRSRATGSYRQRVGLLDCSSFVRHWERTVTHAPATCSIAKQTNPNRLKTTKPNQTTMKKEENGLKHKNPIRKTLRSLKWSALFVSHRIREERWLCAWTKNGNLSTGTNTRRYTQGSSERNARLYCVQKRRLRVMICPFRAFKVNASQINE